MPAHRDDPVCSTAVFAREGEEQFVAVSGIVPPSHQAVRRHSWRSKAVIDETTCPIGLGGCVIEEIAASPAGNWLVTRRSSAQGEWGYDVLRTRPLAREAGVSSERGYMLELPRFSEDESLLVGGFGHRWLGGWWAHPDDDYDQPARGGSVSFGFLIVHRLPDHRVTRHELRVDLPRGWLPDDPDGPWYGPTGLQPTDGGIRMVPSWGPPIEIRAPLPPVMSLPTPHPSGHGVL